MRNRGVGALPSLTKGSYSLLTVACERDRASLLLQARSVGRFVPLELVNQIVIVENGRLKASAAFRGELMDAYGKFAMAVTFARARDLLSAGERRVDGWWSQQAIKLKAAGLMSNPRYLVLDAKNHFVSEITREKIEWWLRPRLPRIDYRWHRMRDHACAALAFVGLEPEQHLTALPQTITPFPMYRELAKATVRSMARLDSRGLAVVLRDRNITEFMCYAATLLKLGHEFSSLYCGTQRGASLLWQGSIAKLDALLEQATFTFAVHHSAWPLLTSRDQERLATFWLRRGLVLSRPEARRLMHWHRARHA